MKSALLASPTDCRCAAHASAPNDACKTGRSSSSRLSEIRFGVGARATLFAALLLALPADVLAAPAASGPEPVYLLGIPVDFILFAMTLLGVALFHHRTLQVALTGLATIVGYKLAFTGFKFGPGFSGLALHRGCG